MHTLTNLFNSSQEGNNDLNNSTLWEWWSEKHLWLRNMLMKFEATKIEDHGGFQSNKELDSKRWEKCRPSWWLDFCYSMQLEHLALTAWIHGGNMPCVNSSGWCWRCNGVGNDVLAHIEPLIPALSIVGMPLHTSEYCCWPYSLYYTVYMIDITCCCCSFWLIFDDASLREGLSIRKTVWRVSQKCTRSPNANYS